LSRAGILLQKLIAGVTSAATISNENLASLQATLIRLDIAGT